MSTVAAPRKRSGRRRWWIIGGIVAALVVVGVAFAMTRGAGTQQPGATPGWTTETAKTGAIEASVSATGNVEPEAQAELSFATEGTVTEILVKAGDTVRNGQPLARIDGTDAQLQIAAAEADYAQAKAAYDKLKAGTSPEDIKEAESQLAQAQAQYQQALAQVSSADVTAARARLEEAQARLNALRGQAKSTDIRDAEAQLQQAQISLQAERDRLSQAKTSAELQLERAVADLGRAQQNYATAKANWDFANETNQDPTNPESPDPSKPGEKVPNKLNDTQRQQYYDAFISAEAALRTAEVGVRDAQVAFDAARQAEVTGVQNAEQQLAIAQSGYDRASSAEPANLAQARAAVASAQAELNRLIGESRASDLAAAQTSVDSAQLALDKLKQGANSYDLISSQADVARADTAIQQAQRALDLGTLKAPFDGIIARVDLRIGEQAGQSGVIAIVNMSSFHIDVPVDELDIAQIKGGQNARIMLDAIPGSELTGVVTTISPLATTSDSGTNTYAAMVELSSTDAGVKPGMTASVELITTRKEGVVLVPRRAIQSEGATTYVLIPSAIPQAPQPAAPGTTPQPGERRPVTLGLSNAEVVEITSGLKAGDQIYVPDIVQTFNPFGG